MHGNSLNDIVRDILPYFYFSLSILFFLQKRCNAQLQLMVRGLPWVISFAGIMYFLRELYIFSEDSSASQLLTQDYLVQSPVVLFATVFLLLNAMLFIKHKRVLTSMLLVSLFSLTLAPLFFTVLRAPVALTLITGLAFLGILHRKKKFFLAFILVFIFYLAAINGGFIVTLLELFIQKQEWYGDNSKIDEVNAAFSHVLYSESILKIIFGGGWGGYMGFSSGWG